MPSSEEVPIQARNVRWLRYHGFVNMGQGAAENVSEFQSHINPMSFVMTVHHNDNFTMILVSLVNIDPTLTEFVTSHAKTYTNGFPLNG